ncbi:MAG: hypothetical protein ABSH41_10725, partial [Syntrophobacteraceae bacterium]
IEVKVLIFLIFVAIYFLVKFMANSKVYVCRDCGYRGRAFKAYKGSVSIEIILWCCFILPGIIYSIYRASSSQKICRNCRHPAIIPADSPILIERDLAATVPGNRKTSSSRSDRPRKVSKRRSA